MTTDELIAYLSKHPGIPVMIETETRIAPLKDTERDTFTADEGPVIVLTPDFTE